MEKKGVSIFDVIRKDDVVVGSMLDELIRAVEAYGFNPAAPILRVVDSSSCEIDMDIAGAISAMNNARIRYEGATCYLTEGDSFEIYAAEWYAEMQEEGEYRQENQWGEEDEGYMYFPEWPSGWCVSEPRNTAKVTPWFLKFGVPLSQPPLGRIGITVRRYYLDEDGSFYYDLDDDFEAFKYADKPDEAFTLRSEELIELNKPEVNPYGCNMVVEVSPDLQEDDVKARLLAALAAEKS